MLELIAQGETVDTRWRRVLPAEQDVEIGRASELFRVPWDGQISRRHVVVRADEQALRVKKLPQAANPVFFGGQEQEEFELLPGQHFVIGSTTFTLAADRAFVSLDVPNPIRQKTFTPEFLKQVAYSDADRRIDVLNRIPEVISSSLNTEDLLTRMVNTLMAGITSAATIGIVRLDPSSASIEVIHWDRRGLTAGDFQPSESLIRQAIDGGETVLHIWGKTSRSRAQDPKLLDRSSNLPTPASQQHSADHSSAFGAKAAGDEEAPAGTPQNYTFDYENDWAFVFPISSEASPGWGIYVAGANLVDGSTLPTEVAENELQADVKFCELVGSTLKNLLQVRKLERQQSSLRNFFSPIVLEALSLRDPEEVLAPRKCDVSVLFCDLRGFSRESERMADQLLDLLARVSDALGIMTNKILQHGGVVGDFHGDAAMGFWGWPLDDENSPAVGNQNAIAALTAALEIQAEFAARFGSADTTRHDQQGTSDFRIGLGIASGQAVAGKIGTLDQVKVTAFGPVVNLAARLESMNRWLGTEILLDAPTCKRAAAAGLDFRSWGRFLPFGLTSPVEVFQVAAVGELDARQMAAHQKMLAAFQAGQWQVADDERQQLPPSDPAGNFFGQQIRLQQSRSDGAWTGVIEMQAK